MKTIRNIVIILLFIAQSSQSQEITRRQIFNVTLGDNVSEYPTAIDTKKIVGNGKLYYIKNIKGFEDTCNETGTGIVTRPDGVIVAALFIFRDDQQPWSEVANVFAQQLKILRVSQDKFKGNTGPDYQAMIEYGENGMDVCVIFTQNGLNIPFPFKLSK